MSKLPSSCTIALRFFLVRYDLEDAFSKYGPVRNVWVARRPPGFAFVEMEDPRDADDAVRGLDGTRICGSRVKVEMSNGGRSKGGRSRSRSRDRGRDRRRSRSGTKSPPRRSRRSPSYKSMSRERDGSRDRSSKRDRKREVSRSRSRS